MSKRKTTITVVTLIILTIIIPVLWIVLIDFEIKKPDFTRDVYLDKSSVEILGEDKVAVLFNLKNSSDISYGGKFLHICPVKDGQYGAYYIDYELSYIGAGQTFQIYLQTELPREQFEDLKVQVRDDESRSVYTSLSESSTFSKLPKVFKYIGWGVVITTCVLLFNKAVIFQLKNGDNKKSN